MKRLREAQERIGEIRELWVEVIFPFLSRNVEVGILLDLCLVSKKWLEMIGSVRFLSINKLRPKKGYSVIVSRFEKVEELVYSGTFTNVLNQFPLLKSLTLSRDPHVSRATWKPVPALEKNLTSLTITSSTYVFNIERLVNLTHLSICCDYVYHMGVKQLKKITHLSIHYDENFVDFLPQESKLVYLESNALSAFVAMGYTGKGKWYEDDNSWEGNWLEGKPHDSGIFRTGNFFKDRSS